MAGHSDTRQPDDIKLHLELIIAADDAHGVAPDGENEEQRETRESVKLRPRLRARIDAVLADVSAQAPGLSAAESAKLLATRDGSDALARGRDALGRVDSHLQSVTGERNPVIGKKYGVYGENPTTFGGVLRALELSVNEDSELAALPEDDQERELLFTALIRRQVQSARDELARLVSARLGTRAELSRAVSLKGETVSEAMSAIAAVREHLYANLPNRKQDPGLRNYGFRPLKTAGRRAKTGAESPNPGPAPDAPPTT